MSCLSFRLYGKHVRSKLWSCLPFTRDSQWSHIGIQWVLTWSQPRTGDYLLTYVIIYLYQWGTDSTCIYHTWCNLGLWNLLEKNSLATHPTGCRSTSLKFKANMYLDTKIFGRANVPWPLPRGHSSRTIKFNNASVFGVDGVEFSW